MTRSISRPGQRPRRCKMGHFSTVWVGPEALCWEKSLLIWEQAKGWGEEGNDFPGCRNKGPWSGISLLHRLQVGCSCQRISSSGLQSWSLSSPHFETQMLMTAEREAAHSWPWGICLLRGSCSFRVKVFLQSMLVSEFCFLWKCLELLS